MRPDRTFLVAAGEAFAQGWHAALQNIRPILALQGVLAAVVAAYYLWPAGNAALTRYADWQASGGAIGTGCIYAVAGGMLSELSLVYAQQKGRWTRQNVENLGFKAVIFFVSGCIVFYFYRLQAHWWGTATTLSVIFPKVLVDQFGYTVFFSAPYYAILTRWQALRYSTAELRQELRTDFVTERLLPILATNWMFWIPAVTFIYAMPSVLQPPIASFATAIWGLLVTALGSREITSPVPGATTTAASPPMLTEATD